MTRLSAALTQVCDVASDLIDRAAMHQVVVALFGDERTPRFRAPAGVQRDTVVLHRLRSEYGVFDCVKVAIVREAIFGPDAAHDVYKLARAFVARVMVDPLARIHLHLFLPPARDQVDFEAPI